LDGDKAKIYAEYVDHGNSLGLSKKDWPCFGYRLEAEGKIIAISGDAVACEGLDDLAFGADVLIQCCYLAEDEINNSALKQLAKHVIATSGQVGKIATRNNVKKLVLTHIEPKSEGMMTSLIEDIKRDYDGEICLGEDLMVIIL
jgi:ribonuclease Z